MGISKRRRYDLVPAIGRNLAGTRLGRNRVFLRDAALMASHAEDEGEARTPEVTPARRAAAARIQVTADQKTGRRTEQWILDLAKQH